MIAFMVQRPVHAQPDTSCPGPLIWYDVEGSAILECGAGGCDYLIVAGNVHDTRHAYTPQLREGLAA